MYFNHGVTVYNTNFLSNVYVTTEKANYVESFKNGPVLYCCFKTTASCKLAYGQIIK